MPTEIEPVPVVDDCLGNTPDGAVCLEHDSGSTLACKEIGSGETCRAGAEHRSADRTVGSIGHSLLHTAIHEPARVYLLGPHAATVARGYT